MQVSSQRRRVFRPLRIRENEGSNERLRGKSTLGGYVPVTDEVRFPAAAPQFNRANALGSRTYRMGDSGGSFPICRLVRQWRFFIEVRSCGRSRESRATHERLAEGNPRISVGWTFFGQFVAHDLTQDRSQLQETEDVTTLRISANLDSISNASMALVRWANPPCMLFTIATGS
jgi:hypothetical protein